jgi:hypothetical protein
MIIFEAMTGLLSVASEQALHAYAPPRDLGAAVLTEGEQNDFCRSVIKLRLQRSFESNRTWLGICNNHLWLLL